MVVTKLSNNYTQTTSRCRIQLELETSLGKALIEENGYSLVKINNAVCKPFKLALWELARCPLTSLNLFDLESENKIYEKLFNKQDDDEMLKIMDYFLVHTMKNLDKDGLNPIYFEDEDEDSLIKQLKLKKSSTFVRPTLNQLLEKVKENGVEKLTKYEKQILDEYARN